MSKTDQDYIEANRQGWNAAAHHHKASARYETILEGFKQPGYSCLDDILTERLLKLGVAGKDVAQLCCNDGCELLSVKNLGAARCVGFDQAGGFLEQARAFQAAAGVECDFVETDIHEIERSYDASFDITLITIGVFGWMPDVKRFVGVASRLLRPGGVVCIYEQHPIVNMMEPYEVPGDPTKLVHSYFKETPFEDEEGFMYDGSASWKGPKKYWFVHTLADIMTALLDEGLAIEAFEEYPHNISSAEFNIYNDQEAQLPQSYMLGARKPT
ncbi:MAG: class I SAM-dependent methyltransferase [Geminicoccales bacterium]